MSRIRTYLQDLLTLPEDAALGYRQEGLRGAWAALAVRSIHRVVRGGRLIVFAHRLDRTIEDRVPPGILIRQLCEADWPALSTLIGQRDLSRFRRLLTGGRHCLVAWRGLKPVGYAWLAERIGPDVSLWPLPYEFPQDAAYLWNLYVLPDERGNGVGSALASARLRLARERGFREGWRMVAPSNAASLSTVRKSASDFRVVGEVRFFQLLRRAYSRFTPAAPGTIDIPTNPLVISPS